MCIHAYCKIVIEKKVYCCRHSKACSIGCRRSNLKNKAGVAEEEAKDAVAAMREAEATEAVEAAKLASSPTKQAGEAAKRALTLYSKIIGH